MKKIFKLCTVLLSSLLILTACSSEKTKVYTAKGKNEDIVVTIHYKGNTVNRLIAKATIESPVSSLDNALKTAKEAISNKTDFSGYKRSAEIKDGKVVLTTEINYDKLDFEKYRERVHLSGSDTLENERKLSTVEDNLKKEGATEQK
ncbi:DUF1307 domain-containing protein [Gemella haemolysans]|uniref:DUF1307 domain-containing protein n=1 Tax=Gemella haemolysans TaxID=1379 RepID=UPI0023799D69|nr:DUF1307 domain-containing protein [Gemella haemolysans]